jgi:hypothetical protein
VRRFLSKSDRDEVEKSRAFYRGLIQRWVHEINLEHGSHRAKAAPIYAAFAEWIEAQPNMGLPWRQVFERVYRYNAFVMMFSELFPHLRKSGNYLDSGVVFNLSYVPVPLRLKRQVTAVCPTCADCTLAFLEVEEQAGPSKEELQQRLAEIDTRPAYQDLPSIEELQERAEIYEDFKDPKVKAVMDKWLSERMPKPATTSPTDPEEVPTDESSKSRLP